MQFAVILANMSKEISNIGPNTQSPVIVPDQVHYWAAYRRGDCTLTKWLGHMSFSRPPFLLIHPDAFSKIDDYLADRNPTWFDVRCGRDLRTDLIFGVENNTPTSSELLEEVDALVHCTVQGLQTREMRIISTDHI